jgi:iron complex outermembrane receptor protein
MKSSRPTLLTCFRLPPCAVLLAAGSLSLSAQTTKTPAKLDDVTNLPVFTVTTENASSYQATESASGTRVVQRIINLPYSVQVLTSEFINDFQLYDIDEQVPFVSNFTGGDKNQGGGGGTLGRGFIVPYFRNGFYRRQAPDSNSIDRVEIVKGPMSAIYGRTSPGGVINYISKKPKTHPEAGVSYSVGSYDYSRAEAYATGPLGDRFSYRIDAARYDLRRPTDFWYNRTLNLSGSFTYKLSDATSLNFEVEHTNRVMNDFQNFTRYVDAAGVTRGLVWDLADKNLAQRLTRFNQAGANRRTDRGNDSYYLTFEHRFSPQFTMRAIGGYSKRSFERIGPTIPGNWNEVATTSFPRNWRGTRTMNEQTIDDWQIGAQVDFTYLFNTPGMQHRTLLTFDGFEDDTKQKTWTLTGTALNNALTAILPAGTPLTAWTQPNPFNLQLLASLPDPVFNPATYVEQDSGTFNLYRSYAGSLLSHTISMLDQRLFLIGAVRADFANFKRQQPLSTVANLKEATTDLNKNTFSVGADYHLRKDLLVGYVSYGSTFDPSPQVDRNTGDILGNKQAKGVEGGLKGILLGQRLSYNVSFFSTQQRNEATANPANPTGSDLTLPALIGGGESRTRGMGIDVSGNLTENLSLLGAIGWMDSRIIANVAAPSLVGQRLTGGQGGPIRSASTALRYGFTRGALAGLRFGLTYQYYPESIRFYGTKNAAGVVTATDIYMPGKSEWGAMVSYSHRLGKKVRINYALNVSNIFNQRNLTISDFYPTGTEARFTTSLRF